MSSSFDLLCIGNAIVDILAAVPHETVEAFGAAPGSMTLIDAETAQSIQARISVEQVAGGGSGANTAAVAARMGAKVAYLGKVAADPSGDDFARDMKAQGLHFPSSPLTGAEAVPTARCIVLVTPDGQRTMFTYLGACTEFTPEDVVAETVQSASITYLEGYLFDKPQAQAALIKAAELARKAGKRVAVTLSDTFCVERHRDAFRQLIAEHIDVLFANEAELQALYQVEDTDAALALVSKDVPLAAVTRGAEGAVVMAEGVRHDVATQPVKLVDTTGAGDAFAAGFMAGLAKGHSLPVCAELGNKAAGAIITRLGARPADDFTLQA
ncbi:sugar kinase [Neokomagataea thailandica NBRC 106555]|uniref:Adenosine kinase n=2 Tax=Neokomagataea TaxID=1223423 RepID=A0A4Y6V942_9PROT|nr:MULTISPECIES: adenosine kinase [Neokomagataea]QDH25026.1 adenosine kinase [Neokomagataea tanensis]GBR51461.1 sugar kinase [Neokomagataea thailandica NBRC 106555]